MQVSSGRYAEPRRGRKGKSGVNEPEKGAKLGQKDHFWGQMRGLEREEIDQR